MNPPPLPPPFSLCCNDAARQNIFVYAATSALIVAYFIGRICTACVAPGTTPIIDTSLFFVMSELFTGICALLVQWCYVTMRQFPIDKRITISLLTIPAIALSLESMNSILTCDESYMVYEVVDCANNSLTMWNNGSFRTTDLLVGIPTHAFRSLSGCSMNICAVFAKSLHWLIGFMCIVAIVDLLYYLQPAASKRPESYLFLLYMTLCTPVVLLAQKILNYDALSLFFGIIAILCSIKGWRRKRPLYLYASIGCAVLAAQEKLIASPLLWLLLMAIPVRIAHTTAAGTSRIDWRSLVKHSLVSFVMVMASLLIFQAIISIVNVVDAPAFSAKNVFMPFLSGFWPLLRLTGTDAPLLSTDATAFPVICTAGALFCTVFLLQIAGAFIVRHTDKLRRGFIERYLQRYGALHTLCLLFFVVAGGVLATYTVHAYLAPYFPVEPGTVTGLAFNKSSVYFAARSHLAHGLLSIAWAYATFVNALPTVIVLLSLLLSVFNLRSPCNGYSGFSLLAAASLGAPFLFGILQIPVGNRYFNIFIVIIVLWIATESLQLFYRSKVNRLLISAAIIALLIEIAPFRPLFGAFRPLWSNYSSVYNLSPSKAVLNPWWMGWGEEIFLAGKRIRSIEQNSNPTLSGVTIYQNNPGTWLCRRNASRLVSLDTATTVSYSAHDYFVLSRMGIAQSTQPIPYSAPLAIVKYRGFVTAWIFRGSDLPRDFFQVSPKETGEQP